MIQLIISGIIIICVLVCVVFGIIEKKKKKELLKKKIEFEQRELFVQYKNEVSVSLAKILDEKTEGFPWLATAIADYYENYEIYLPSI